MALRHRASHQAAPRTGVSWFGTLRILTAAAFLTALSVVLGKYLGVTLPLHRFSLENLPILAAGIFLGPVVGGAVGTAADLIGCALNAWPVNPLVTLGSALVGLSSGLAARLLPKRADGNPRAWSLWVSVAIGHATGTMIVKTIGLALYTSTPPEALLWRIPLYAATGAVEGAVLLLLNRSRLFTGALDRVRGRLR